MLLLMAIADGALYGIHSLDDLWEQRIGEGDNEKQLLWKKKSKNQPIARRIRNGQVSPTEPWPVERFRKIFRDTLQQAGYVGIQPRINQVRRETGIQLESR